jgi:peptide/nickel transport system substrate-binding protein
MNDPIDVRSVTRREVLQPGTVAAVLGTTGALGARPALAQSARRGGVFRVRHHVQPVHFDPHQTIAFSTMMSLSYCMSRLVKITAGPGVVPGTQPLEPDLAESWTQVNDTTYLFRLRKGVRWHPKPPVNGRELTADDVKYTYDRFLTIKGNGNRPVLETIERIETVDRYTVRSSSGSRTRGSSTRWRRRRRGSSRRRPWTRLATSRSPRPSWAPGPGCSIATSRERACCTPGTPHYFVANLPYADGVDVTLDADPASAFASFITGKYDLGPEDGFVVRRVYLDVAKQNIPGLQTRDFIVIFGGITWMKLDQEPLKDVRVRRALGMASNWREVLETNAWSQGQGSPNPAIPAALKEWSIPIADLTPEDRKLYEPDPGAARRLLADAGHPSGFKVPVESTPGYGPDYVDAVQIALRNWKDAGVEADLKLKEYGAYVSSTIFGKFDRMAVGLRGGTTSAAA